MKAGLGAPQTKPFRSKVGDPGESIASFAAVLADGIEQDIRLGENEWTVADLKMLDDIRSHLETDHYSKEASSIRRVRDEVFSRSKRAQYIVSALSSAVAWVVTWVFVVALYPYSKTVRTVFLTPSILHRIWALGFVDLVLLRSRWIRWRLLAPFHEQLLGKAFVEPQDAASYFEEIEVAGPDESSSGDLWQVCYKIKQPVVIEAPSGCGKTLFLKQLAHRLDHEIVCYLPAPDCKDGVLAAIAAMFSLEKINDAFLGSLLRQGSLILLIDGLNEVSPSSTRPLIFDLMLRYPEARILATTQRLADDPPRRLLRYRILDLDRTRAASLMQRRLEVIAPAASHLLGARDAIQAFLDAAEDLRRNDLDPYLAHTPLDLTLAAELIAEGKKPSPIGLVEQQIERAADRVLLLGKTFRRRDLSDRVWDRLMSGDRTLDLDGFQLEVTALNEQKLIVAVQKMLVSGEAVDKEKVQIFYEFRHNRIRDFFLAIHAMSMKDSQIAALADDEDMRGVILVLAETMDLDRVTRLEQVITTRELETRHIIVAEELRRRLVGRLERSNLQS